MRVFLMSYGCSANQADSEVLSGCLAKAGYELISSVKEADVIVVNTCAVKGPTENRVIDALKRIPRGKKLIVAGCLPHVSFERLCREVCFDGAVGSAVGNDIVGIVDRVMAGEKVVALSTKLEAKPSLCLPRVRSNPVVSVIPINYGCLGSCTYCCVVFARGRLRSYDPEEVVERMQQDLIAGTKEFWITSQDVACYGRDIGRNLADLLEQIVKIKGDFRVRVGMMTPSMITDITANLVSVFKNEKIFKFVHLPLQSGDNNILKRMNRHYDVQQFKDIVNAFRTAFPEVTLATDVICGFPGETQEAFENTLELINEVKPDIVNVSKFFPRPKTAASSMQSEFVDLPEIKRRSTAAAELAKRIAMERNQKWIGWVGETLIDEKGKVPGTWIGRNFAYKPVAVKSPQNLFGEGLLVKVVNAFSTYLSGGVC